MGVTLTRAASVEAVSAAPLPPVPFELPPFEPPVAEFVAISFGPQPALAELALEMGARYLALPRAQAAILAGTLGSALAE